MSQHAQLTARQIHGPFIQLFTNLQGKNGDQWLTGLKRFLRTEQMALASACFPVWKTITVGKYRTHNGLALALRNAGCSFENEFVQNMLRRVHLVPLKREIDLVCLNLADLGLELEDSPFKNGDLGVFYKDVCARALTLGLRLCPAETGPYLRLQYLDQPSGECINIASEPIGCRHTDELFALSNFSNTEQHPHQRLKLGWSNGHIDAYHRSLTYPYWVFELPR